MKRSLAVSAVVVSLLAGGLSLRSTPQHQTHATPSFLEVSEHGFDPISSCKTHELQPLVTTNVNLIERDTIMQAGGAQGCVAPQNEPALAVNPLDSKNLIAGANDYRICCDAKVRHDGTGWAYFSKNGGSTWHNVLVKGLTRETGGQGPFSVVDSAGDPSLAFGSDGTAYYANMVFSRLGVESGLAIAKSKDGGAHWGAPKLLYWTNDASVFSDKEWVTAGPNGKLVVTWTRFAAVGFASYEAPIYEVVSRNSGKTWSFAHRVSDQAHTYNQGSIPLFDSKGNLYISYETATPPDFKTDAIGVSYSRDLNHFKTTEVARDFDGKGCFPLNSDQRGTLTGMAFRFSTLPAAAINADDTLAVTWADGEQGCTGNPDFWPKHTNAQVKLVFVNGTHFSATQTVTSGADKAEPAVTWVGKTPVVSFYTRSFTDCVTCLDYAYASVKDGWVEHRLSDGSSDTYEEFGGVFIGDYTALVSTGEQAYAVWTDSRGANQNILGQSFTP